MDPLPTFITFSLIISSILTLTCIQQVLITPIQPETDSPLFTMRILNLLFGATETVYIILCLNEYESANQSNEQNKSISETIRFIFEMIRYIFLCICLLIFVLDRLEYLYKIHINTIIQESVMYLYGADNTHIIKYTYTDASNCAGEYAASIATRNPNDFVCDNNQEVHNKHYSSTWVGTNTCQNGELYSCDDNTQYTLNEFENENCHDLPTQATTYSATQYLDDTDAAAATLSYDIFCNEPDPMTAVLNFPDNSMFISTGHISWSGDSTLTKSIETAVCLTERSEGQYKEIGDVLVSYCFVGYDDVYSKPIPVWIRTIYITLCCIQYNIKYNIRHFIILTIVIIFANTTNSFEM